VTKDRRAGGGPKYHFRRRQRSGWLYNGRVANSLGNAFHRLRAYVHPHVKHVITQTLEQGDEADFVGSEQNVHIHRQAVKIQRGEQVDQVTALLKADNGIPRL
jgi:hypothetical protein